MSNRQSEVKGRHESMVVEGDDEDHVLPASELDPFTPEPEPGPRPRLAIWLALAVLVVLAAIVIFAAFR
jgi:hypothetical protein